MYSAGWGFFLLGIIFLWLATLTFLVWQNLVFLKRLFPKQGKSFREKLEEVLQQVGGLEEFKTKSIHYIQNVSLKRYNPYKDTGGDQSFSVALLNGLGDGVVMTSLHSRSATRVFAKTVKGGKQDQFELSDEEAEVIKQALSQ